MGSVDDVVAERLEKSYQVFEARFPDLSKKLHSIGEPTSEVVWEGEIAVNIDMKGTNLYPDNAVKWTEGQLRGRDETMERILFETPLHCNLSGSTNVAVEACGKFFEGRPVELRRIPQQEIEFCFIFGLGLGHHIQELLSSSEFHVFVIIEPVSEFIVHSMRVVDWEAVFETVDSNGASVVFVTEDTPERAVRHIESLVCHYGNIFLDGSILYAHYYSWPLKETHNLFLQMVQSHYVTSGFYEDEKVMCSNTVANFSRHSFRLMRYQDMLEQRIPVFIIGCGSSLDKDVGYIKKWQGRVIVVSVGSSLGVLLKAGVAPDIHVELENGTTTPTVLRDLASAYDISKIRLMATTTLHPDVADLFSSVWFFFRPQLSSTILFGGDEVPLSGSFPVVANAAFSGMLRLGFRSLYLFGCDCGTRDMEKHHAEGSLYGDDQYTKGRTAQMFAANLGHKVPGNFGGTIYSDWLLDVSRRVFSETVRGYTLDAWNCSDGAKIEGFSPLAAGAIRLDNTLVSKEKSLERVDRQLPFFRPPDFLRPTPFSDWVKEVASYREVQACILEEIRTEAKGSYRDLLTQIKDLNSSGAGFAPIMRLAGTSMEGLIRYGAFVGNRILDPDMRKEFFVFFVSEYEKIFGSILDDVEVFLKELEQTFRAAKKSN